jgi:hypothetical protein
MTNDDQSSALGVGIWSVVGHCHWSLGIARVRQSGSSMSRPATRGARAAREAGMADAMEGQGVTRSVHHARRKKVSRCGASGAGKREDWGKGRRVKAEGNRRGGRKCKTEGSGLPMTVRRSKSPSPQPSPGVPGEGAGTAPVRNFLQFLCGALVSTVNGSASNSAWRKIEVARGGQWGLSTLIAWPKNVRKRKKRKVDRGFQGVARGEGLHFFV